MLNQFAQFAMKVVFTGILLIVVFLCVIEIWRLWFDRTWVLVPFDYVRNGQTTREAGQNFTRILSQDLARIRDVRRRGLSTADLDKPSTAQVGAPKDIELPVLREPTLSSVEIQAYGIHISNLLRTLSRWIERPNAIAGNVSESSEGVVDVYAELQKGWRSFDAEVGHDRWYLSQRTDVSEASFALACRIYRRLLQEVDRNYAEVSDAEFCDYVRARWRYQVYGERIAETAGGQEAKRALAQASDIVTELSNRNCQFPLVYELAGYISVAEGDVIAAGEMFTRYLELLAERWETTDERTEEFLLQLEGKRLPTDVSVLQTAEQLGLRGQMRPVQPGTSVSTVRGGAGTICCVVQDNQGTQYLLSSEHVFQGSSGTPILQPGVLDGGLVSDQIAVLARSIQIRPDMPNQVAGAIARLDPEIAVSPEIRGIGRIQGIAQMVNVGATLRAVGRTSGLVTGTVMATELSAHINTPDPVLFEGLIRTTRISGPGDSGAPVLNEDNELVGMVYAGSSEFSLVIPIGPILKELSVELVR